MNATDALPPGPNVIDLGHGHTATLVGWHPDRQLNPRYADLPDVEVLRIHVKHPAPDGAGCIGAITLDCEVARQLFPGRPTWTLIRLDPLTVTPSLLCDCGDHGFITDGRWVPA